MNTSNRPVMALYCRQVFEGRISHYLMKPIRTIDLFAGVGGIRLGFEKAGFKTVYSNDIDKHCKITYDLNFKSPTLDNTDIWKVDTGDIPKFDVLLGGFPCQAFSIAGYRHGFRDPKGRGNLFFRVAEILEERKPGAFLLENVKNLKGHDSGKTYKTIRDTLEYSLGYFTTDSILNSMTHGNMPQNRERIFIAGFKKKKDLDRFAFPEPVKLTTNFKDFLEEKVDGKYFYNNKPLYPRIVDGITSENAVYQWRRHYVRENKKGVVPTLTANMGSGGHNVPIIKNGNTIRKLTPRECFLLQGFPKSYKLPAITDSQLYHQAGNSVTVSVVERIASNLARVINDDLKIANPINARVA